MNDAPSFIIDYKNMLKLNPEIFSWKTDDINIQLDAQVTFDFLTTATTGITINDSNNFDVR